jgi:hypothetical protein
VPLENFVTRRVEFLASCLPPASSSADQHSGDALVTEKKLPSPLFHSQPFHSCYEELAQRNLRWEIDSLQQMLASEVLNQSSNKM